MKKVLIVLLSLILVACGSSKLSWDKVSEKYNELEATVSAETVPSTFLRSDYIDLLEAEATDLESLEAGVSEDEEALADNIYTNAVKLRTYASLFSSSRASELTGLANELMEIVKAAYDKDENFADRKNAALTRISEISSWSSEDWEKLEIRPLITWAEAEEEYLALEQETIDALNSLREVTENELEENKNIIADNYEKLLNGVNDANKDTAKDIYAAAISLYEYTKDLEGDAGVRVNSFARMAREYVELALGKQVDDPEYDFLNVVESTKRWSLGMWNEVTTEMKMYRYY